MRYVFSLFVLTLAHAVMTAQTPTEVVFRVGGNSQVVWFDINNPTINGALDISTNGFFGATGNLNAAIWDPVRTRLVFIEQGTSPPRPWYAIDMLGQGLVAGSSVNVVSRLSSIGNPVIGTGNGGVPQGGYRPSDGSYYILEGGTDLTYRLNQDGLGNLISSTVFGNLNGAAAPDIVTGGDLDFSATDKMWMAGVDGVNNRLWRFGTGAGLPTEFSVITTDLYNGITFDSTRTVLYGYQAATSQYGIINQTTGALTVISTDPLFAGFGDLTSGIRYESFGVPEPGTWALIGLAISGICGGLYGVRRRKQAMGEKLLV